jgi:hypothetical protein
MDGVLTFSWSKGERSFHRRMAGRCTRHCTYPRRALYGPMYDWLCGVSTLSAAHWFSPLRRGWCHGYFSLSQATLVRWSISKKHPFFQHSHSKLSQVIRSRAARPGPVVRICSNDLRTAFEVHPKFPWIQSRALTYCVCHKLPAFLKRVLPGFPGLSH